MPFNEMMSSRFITTSSTFLKGTLRPNNENGQHLLQREMQSQDVIFECAAPLNTEGRHYVLDADIK